MNINRKSPKKNLLKHAQNQRYRDFWSHIGLGLKQNFSDEEIGQVLLNLMFIFLLGGGILGSDVTPNS